MRPALAHVRANRFLADGMELEFVDKLLKIMDFSAERRPHFQPFRMPPSRALRCRKLHQWLLRHALQDNKYAVGRPIPPGSAPTGN